MGGLIGIGEVLVNPVLQHKAYEGAPESMRSMLQAFNLFAMGGMPNAVSSALSLATAVFTPNNLNNGNLPMVYYINAVFGLVGCALYYAVGKSRANSSKTVHKVESDANAVLPPVLLNSKPVDVSKEKRRHPPSANESADTLA